MSGEGSRKECTICSEFLETDVHMLDDCRHTFHRACITPWLGSHKICPDCPQLNASNEMSICLKCSIQIAKDEITFDCGHAFHVDCLTRSCFECERLTSPGECPRAIDSSAGCSLCSQVILEDGLSPNCGHSYHKVCLTEWLESYNPCPSCPQRSTSEDSARGGIAEGTTDSCPDCQSTEPQPAEPKNTSTHCPTTCLICFHLSDGEEHRRASPTTCIICSEEILPKHGKTLHCGHTFHKVCINSWQNSCAHCHQPSLLIQQTVTPDTTTVPIPETDMEECSICLEEASLEAISLQCGHSFHIECLTPWLGEQCSCPNCREPCIIHIPGYVYRTMRDSPFFGKIMTAAQVGSLDLILYS